MQINALDYPVYTCHKQVRAFEIKSIQTAKDGQSFVLSNNAGCEATVDHIWLLKHRPEDALHASALIGGYFILYPNGHESWSPAQAFIEGYTKNPEVQDVNARGSIHPEDPAA